MKINNTNSFRAADTKRARETMEPLSTNESGRLYKDEFRREAQAGFSRSLSDRALAQSDFIVDISDKNSTITSNPWWTEDLKNLLPPLPEWDAILSANSVDNVELFSILKAVAMDKSHLAVNLGEIIIG